MKRNASTVSAVVTALMLSLLSWGALFAWLGPPDKFEMQVTLTTSASGIVQLFYNPTGGAPFSERDSVRVQAVRVRVPVRYGLSLPPGTYTSFRLDPIDRESSLVLEDVRIMEARLWGFDYRVIREIPPDRFRPVNQILSSQISGGGLQIVTAASANDPILVVSLDAPVLLRPSFASTYGVPISALISIFTIFLWADIKTRDRKATPTSKAWNAIAGWARRHEQGAVFAVALAGAILSCYPVVFYGRSFVSPDNGGTWMLY